MQPPVPVSQVSVVQTLLSLQTTGFDPTHAPSTQLSVCVQALWSVQEFALLLV